MGRWRLVGFAQKCCDAMHRLQCLGPSHTSQLGYIFLQEGWKLISSAFLVCHILILITNKCFIGKIYCFWMTVITSHLKLRIKHLNINPTYELCPHQADLFHNCPFPWKRNWRSQACGELQSFSRCEVLKTNTSSCGCRVYVGHATWDRKRYLAHCHNCVKWPRRFPHKF